MLGAEFRTRGRARRVVPISELVFEALTQNRSSLEDRPAKERGVLALKHHARTPRNPHRAFVATLGSEAVWLDYFTIQSVAERAA